MLGRIYTIKCSEDPRVYVGSTFRTLEDRFQTHVNCINNKDKEHRPLYKAMNEYGVDKFTIELLEEVDDVDKTILFRIEGMHIEMHQESLIPLFNKNIAGRDLKQYREANKEQKREYDKQYYEDNKEHIKEQTKQYREDNKEHIREYNKQYREANKERSKQYRESNKERLSKYYSETIVCECGAAVTRRNISTHKRTQKHINWESTQ